MRKIALALVVAPLLVALLLGVGELACRLAPSSTDAAAPKRFFEPGKTEDGRAALVPAANPPLPGARFRMDALPLARPPSTVRLLCLGDSTVHGHPFEPPVPFADWLAARLPRLVGRFGFDVQNLGVNAMHSESVLTLLCDLAPLRPDVVVVYVGHNEFLDQWLPALERPFSHRVERLLDRSCLGRRLRAALTEKDGTKAEGGVAALRRRELVHDAPLLSKAVLDRGEREFARNLAEIVARIRELGALPLLGLPVCDLLDTPPEWSNFTRPLQRDERTRYRERLEQAIARRQALDAAQRANAKTDVAGAARGLLAELDALAGVDPGVARLAYERGRLLLLLGDVAGAERELLAARDMDGHPIRATSARLDAIRSVARDTGAWLVDPWPLFEAAAPRGIAGQDGLFVDYCHPDLAGHRLLADAIVRELSQRGAFVPLAQWRFAQEPGEEGYEAAMGLSHAAQANSLARRGLFALGQTFFDSSNAEALAGADQLFVTALRVDERCALACAGRAAVALVRGDSDRAFEGFERAAELDRGVLDFFAEKYDTIPAVKELFESGGLAFRDGRVIRS